ESVIDFRGAIRNFYGDLRGLEGLQPVNEVADFFLSFLAQDAVALHFRIIESGVCKMKGAEDHHFRLRRVGVEAGYFFRQFLSKRRCAEKHCESTQRYETESTHKIMILSFLPAVEKCAYPPADADDAG